MVTKLVIVVAFLYLIMICAMLTYKYQGKVGKAKTILYIGSIAIVTIFLYATYYSTVHIGEMSENARKAYRERIHRG